MKSCPQCNATYENDYVFCLTDGNALLDCEGEQETLVNRKIFMRPEAPASEIPAYCVSCGLENKAHSKFCKKCGGLVEGVSMPSPQLSEFGFSGLDVNAYSAGQPFGETVTFQPPTFVPSTASPNASSASNKSTLIAGFAVGAFLLLGVFYIALNNRSPSDSGKSVGSADSKKSNPGAGSSESSLPDTFDRYYDGSVESGRRTFSLTLHLKRDRSNLTGSAETNSYDELTGSIQPDGSFQANGTPVGKPTTGVWKGRISSDGSVNGSWSTLDGTKTSPFSVTERK